MDLSDHTLQWIRSPGFVLQNNASQMFFNCNAGSVNSDPKFIESYAKLYEKPLKQFIRGSGKSFSNHNDAVIRTGSLNVYEHLNGSLDEMLIKKGICSIDTKIQYCNPERNDRRIIDSEIKEAAEFQGVYYSDQPWDADEKQMDLGFTLSWDDSTMLPFTIVHGRVEEGPNYPKEELDSDETVTSIDFEEFYNKYWKDNDNAAKKTFLDATKEVFADGHILKEDTWQDNQNWAAIKSLMELVFQTKQQATADKNLWTQAYQTSLGDGSPQAHQDEMEASAQKAEELDDLWNDTVGWGIDLTRPFWKSMKFYVRTAAVMLLLAC